MEEKKVVLITGGAMGQGRAHAYKYAENGFNVVLADMLDPSHEALKKLLLVVKLKEQKFWLKKQTLLLLKKYGKHYLLQFGKHLVV